MQQQPLRHLIGGQEVFFCHGAQAINEAYAGPFITEVAAVLNGAPGVVRARANHPCPTCITQAIADRLGLARRRLGGGGAKCILGNSGAVDVLLEPLNVQLLAGPGRVAVQFTVPVVVVVPGTVTFWEMQLGHDFFKHFDAADIPSQGVVLHRIPGAPEGATVTVPFIAPRPIHPDDIEYGSSTFLLARDSYQEALDLALTRESVLARRRQAAAAAGAGSSDGGVSSSQSPAEAAREAAERAAGVAAAAAGMPAAAAAAGSGPAYGSQQWVDEWAPAASSRPRQQQGNRRGRGRNRRGGQTQQQSRSRSAAAAADSGADGQAAAAAAGGGVQPDVTEGLDPLPSGLVACSWTAVAEQHLPQGDDECIICTDAFTAALEGELERLVVQLHCRHTFCEVCLRQFSTTRNFRTRPLTHIIPW